MAAITQFSSSNETIEIPLSDSEAFSEFYNFIGFFPNMSNDEVDQLLDRCLADNPNLAIGSDDVLYHALNNTKNEYLISELFRYGSDVLDNQLQFKISVALGIAFPLSNHETMEQTFFVISRIIKYSKYTAECKNHLVQFLDSKDLKEKKPAAYVITRYNNEQAPARNDSIHTTLRPYLVDDVTHMITQYDDQEFSSETIAKAQAILAAPPS